jgi:ATP-dependent protease Clp ATPase subunit
MEGHLLSCTFCKRSEKQVAKLVAGPGVYICDVCTERAHAIIHEGSPPAPSSLLQRAIVRLRRVTSRREASVKLSRAARHAV